MLSNTPELDGFSVVTVGKFNPAIFHPTWLASRNLITEEQSDLVDIKVVSPDITSLVLKAAADEDHGVNLSVDPERFTVSSDDVLQMPRVLDLVKNVLGVLAHTPVAAIGINRHQHFRTSTIEEWHTIGHKLAPKDLIWADDMTSPGLRTLKVETPVPEFEGAILIVTVEPSRKIHSGQGIFIHCNLTFDISRSPEQETYSTAARAADRLQEGWDYTHSLIPIFHAKLANLLTQ